ncbi:hypothetical protein AGOR_G00061390 [Albula goreensis]|uniref:Poly [ADP-ribose] polymerase n=1 Tax=Albula goreensis TaxID=1534307 RepID=A0A8T3DSV6_9TELE|nr:hypothetical protein AGOR_G00061390 [Albula goreensis]
MSEGVVIPIDAAKEQLLIFYGEDLTSVMQSKFGVRTILHNMEKAGRSGSSRKAQMKGVKTYSVHLPSGVEVSVWKDDLTTHRVDAVVNAANEQLHHGGGLARALVQAGGPEIQRLSDQIIKTKGNVPTGEAVCTPPGNLPCKFIFHAVGPYLPPYSSKTEVEKASGLLKRAVHNILSLAENNKCKSVAIPALSSGLFNFPLDRCAIAIVKTLQNHNFRRQSPLSEVHLVNNDDPTVSAMEKACREILGSNMSYSRAVSTTGTSLGVSSLQLGSITLRMKQGNIEQEKVDVIVNTIAHDLDLSSGEISRAIFSRAGAKIQHEIKKFPCPSVSGKVMETLGHKLNCKYVYHTVCADQSTRPTTQILRSVVKTCLDKAVKANHSSISFPAIGTGNLGFDKTEVAKIMIGEVVNFALWNNGKKMDINIVVYPSNKDTVKAFQEEMLQHENKQTTKSSISRMQSIANKEVSGYESDETTNGGPPSIELIGSSHCYRHEACRWLNNICMASDKHTIINNHILQFGQREHKQLLSLQSKWKVSIREFLQNGQAGVTITGSPSSVKGAVLGVEALCCQAQEEFALTEENTMMQAVDPQASGFLKNYSMKQNFDNKSFYQRIPSERTDYKFPGLKIHKIERVENPLLKHHFQLKERQVASSPKLLYQQVPMQFCDLVCRVGFHRQFSPPDDQMYGAGIYFGGSVHTAMKMAKNLGYEEEYIYIFEAKVLTGKDTLGSPKLIVPPAVGIDPLYLYDSVYGGKDTHVIFNSHQALPLLIFTCTRMSPYV